MKESKQFDVVIVGGGMIGASMALALAPLPIRIAVVDVYSHDHQKQPSFDDRSIALSYGSRVIFEAMNVWQDLEPQTEAIRHIHVSDKGHMGMCRLHAEEYGTEALGYVVENRVAGNVFHRLLEQHTNITVITPAQVTAVEHIDKKAILTIDREGSLSDLSCRLVIAADGTHSPIATQLAVEKVQSDYEQMAVICNIVTSHHKAGWAYERFTDTGPLAFLPLTNQRISVVWSFAPEQRELIEEMTEKEFREALQQHFGFRTGNIERVGKRVIYPLSLRQLKVGFKKRVAFIGNALHTGHPVAGQGFNLGLRDIAQLTEVVATAVSNNDDIGSYSNLDKFWTHRKNDIQSTLSSTDALARLFANKSSVLTIARNGLLKWLDVLGPVKTEFSAFAMGQKSNLPSLARGIPLNDIHFWPKLNAHSKSNSGV
ncbi:2-octaprenyl-6-methoxyphenyl hydroxylase [Pleionea sediminis]|uniref:2-octaprenyl-6-methoxyphenyl hydroxylase n=1 Tax=Pleionea sediminis TaxID=2569479 RepID=UPI0011862E72|nr:2-octaprenyl-6-methoxyphenyl hydroxylase [Pleionea sediminis]